MVKDENFTSANVLHLWGIVIVMAIAATVLGTILTHIVSAIIEAVKTGEEDPKVEDSDFERDTLVHLNGTKVAYVVSSIGVLLAMLTFVFGHSPLGMFTLIILAGILAQITRDISRLVLYRR